MKAKFLALAALVLGLASCQTEPEGFDVVLGGEQEVTINVSLPGVTRGSADSGIVNVDFDVYDVRYVLEVYDVATEPAQLASRDVKTTDDTSTAFDVRLVPDRDYKFVVWADIVANGSTDDNHYITTNGLTNITLNGEWNAMDETRDAYTDVVEIKGYNSGSTIEMTLVRPFGKLRAVTTDIDALEALQNNALPKSVQVIYSVGALSEFNALTEKASEPVAQTFTYDLTNVYGESGNELTLFSDYLFGTASGTMQFQMNVTLENGNVVSNTFNTEIPIVRNQITTLIGSILTDANDVKVEIEDEFAGEEIILVGEHTLTADLEITNPIVVKAGTTAVLNLNGFDIINTNKTNEYGKGEGIVVYGDLTINGEGTIQGATRAVWARGNNGAKITINGGTFKGCESGYTGGGNSVIYASSGNVIDIYGGTFEALAEDTESYADTLWPVLNIADNNGMINVYGGSFKGQNPAAPGTEPKTWNDAHPNGFVAEGLGAAVRGDYYVVVPEIVATLDNVTADTTVEMTEDLSVGTNTTIHTQTATGDITIDGNGNSIVSSAESANDFQWEGGNIPAMSTVLSSKDGSLITVSNLTFEGTMSALMLGHYVDSNSNWYNTVLNNVNVIDTKVVSFSQNIAPAVCVYGTATLNNCNIYGTTLSELDTDPMWPVYDLAAVNYSKTTINGGKIGSFYIWNQAEAIIENGAEVETLIVRGNMNTTKYGVTIKAGTTVGTIDLSAISNKAKVNFTIEAGATVGKIVANGVEYASIDEFKNTTAVTTTEALSEALTNGNSEVVVAAGTYTFPTSSIQAGQTIKCEEGTVFTGNTKLNINGATVVGATFSNPSGTAVDQTINGTFKNCTFTGSNGLRWCYAGETVVFENCVFEGAVYGVHFDGGANDVVFKNCVISGFNTLGGAITHLTLEGCTFRAGRSGYNGINLWGNTTMKDCKFEFDGTKTEWVDFVGDNKNYIIDNCELNGVVCTAENRESLGILNNYGTGNTIKINGVEL